MDLPTFDADGYPTDATLRALARWPANDIPGGLALMVAAWHWSYLVSAQLRPEEVQLLRAEPSMTFVRFATGGWSGNESLVAAFLQSPAGRLSWQLSKIGGLHIFRIRGKDGR